jgi:hypothetical protein
MPPLSRPVRLLVIAVSVGVLATALLAAAAALGAPILKAGERPGWAMFGFELVTMTAATLGVLLGLGRYPSGPGLGLACIAGTILVASALGWQSVGRQIAGVPLTPLLAIRAAAAGLLGAAGAWTVLSRRPGALAVAIRGGLLVLPVLLLAGALVYPTSRRLLDRAVGASPAILFIAVTVGFLVTTALIAAGVHLVIQAFEMGRTEEPTSRSA